MLTVLFCVADLISFEGDLIMGYHVHENTVNTSKTQPSDTRRSGDSQNQPDRKTERRNFLPPVKRKESGEFTIFNIPGWQIVGRLRADLHGTTLTHATSLRQAYDMTWDHLHACNIFTYKIKYAKVCTGIYGPKIV